MTGRLKILGLALLAALTMAAWSAGAAHAELEFQALETIQYGESEEEQEDVPAPATLHATQVTEEPITIRLGTAKMQCTTATATASLSTGSSPTLDLSPSYSGCNVSGLTTEVQTGGCSFHVDLLEELETTQFSAQTDIVCPSKSEILATVKFLGKTACLIHIGPQTGLEGVKAITMTKDSPEDFTLKHEVTTLKATVTNGQISCFFITPGEYTKVEVTGNTLVTANSTGEGTPPSKVGPKRVKKIHFGIEKEKVWILGSVASGSPNVFGFDLGKVECESGSAVNLVEKPTKKLTSLRFSPVPSEYQKCKYQGSTKETEVLLNECSYELMGVAVNNGALTGGLRIPCQVPVIKVKIKEFCTVVIPEQLGSDNLGLRRVTFQNGGSGKTSVIRATFQVVGLKYYEEENNPEGGCPQPNVLKDNGTLTGSLDFSAVEAEGEEKQVGLWVAQTP